MSTQKHTQTPWRIGGRDGRAWTITDRQSEHAAFPVIFGGFGNRVCNVDSHEKEDCDANAALIVQAVNSHDVLLEAARAAIAAIGHEFLYQTGQTVRPAQQYPPQGTVCSQLGDVVELLRDAIAAAERRPE